MDQVRIIQPDTYPKMDDLQKLSFAFLLLIKMNNGLAVFCRAVFIMTIWFKLKVFVTIKSVSGIHEPPGRRTDRSDLVLDFLNFFGPGPVRSELVQDFI